MIIDHCQVSDVPRLRRLWQQAFGDTDAFLNAFFSVGFAPERSLCVRPEDEIAAALYWFDCELDGQKLAYLYAVATDADHRGQGLCHSLMAQTHGLLAQQGYAGAVLVPGSGSLFRFYEKMGYRRFGGIQQITATAAVAPARLEAVTAEEYARLRKQFLPVGGVVQEGALLRFLATQAQFYKGEDLLLCCIREGDRLIVPELLGSGNPADILTALGCVTGVFRTPGETPFAMFFPLREGTATPKYFAFALD